MLSEYIQEDHGLNLNSRQDLKTGNYHGADSKVMAMSGGEIDNENGMVFMAIAKYLLKKNISGASEITNNCYNPKTGYYSRWNPIKYPPSIHKSDMSLDNLIGIAYCSNSNAARRINRKMKSPFYIYDDIEFNRIGRSLILRPDFIYYIKSCAGDNSKWLFFIPFLVLRYLSSVREKVSRPTIYQFLAAHFKRLIGKRYSHVDTIWNRWTGWDTSGKDLTLIMIDDKRVYIPKWYKKLTYKAIGSIGALFTRYFNKTGKPLLRPLIEQAQGLDGKL
jgi:hypothetical protein